MLTKKQFKALANFEGGLCVSIYLPTHRSGQEVLEHVDQLILKNQIKEVAEKMEKKGFSEQAIDDFLEPVRSLSKDSKFWRNQSEGLAIFIASQHFEYFNLPFSVDPYIYVAYGFYLKPVVPLFANDGKYYLLTLNFHEVDLYMGSREGLEKFRMDPPLPQRVENVVGMDYRPKFLDYRAGSVGGHQEAFFHGQAEWQADEKDEILHFFKAIDKIVVPLLNQNPHPLVVATLDYLQAIYKDANTYFKLYPEGIAINPKELSLEELHQKCWNMLAFHFAEQQEQIAEQLQIYRDTRRTSADIQDIIPAAINGQVEALFLDKEEEIWGLYNKKNASTEIQREQNPSNASLTNLAAIQVFLNGGSVFLTTQEAMPLPYSPVNALFRYA